VSGNKQPGITLDWESFAPFVCVMVGTERVGDLWQDRSGRFVLWHFEACALAPDGAWRIIGHNDSGDIVDAALELAAHHAAQQLAAERRYEAALDGEAS